MDNGHCGSWSVPLVPWLGSNLQWIVITAFWHQATFICSTYLVFLEEVVTQRHVMHHVELQVSLCCLLFVFCFFVFFIYLCFLIVLVPARSAVVNAQAFKECLQMFSFSDSASHSHTLVDTLPVLCTQLVCSPNSFDFRWKLLASFCCVTVSQSSPRFFLFAWFA